MVKVQDIASVAVGTQIKGFLKGCLIPFCILSYFQYLYPHGWLQCKIWLCKPSLGTSLGGRENLEDSILLLEAPFR